MHSNLRVLGIFTLDIIVSAILFCIVFAVAIGLSELIKWSEMFFQNSALVIFFAKGVKIVMLFCDTVLLIQFVVTQTIHTSKLLKTQKSDA